MFARVFHRVPPTSQNVDYCVCCRPFFPNSDLAGVVNGLGSAIGLWAILYSNARAAKLFLRSQALVFVMSMVLFIIHAIASSEAKTGEYWATIAFSCIVTPLFWGMYDLKVRMVFQHSFFCFVSLASPVCTPLSLSGETSILRFDQYCSVRNNNAVCL